LVRVTAGCVLAGLLDLLVFVAIVNRGAADPFLIVVMLVSNDTPLWATTSTAPPPECWHLPRTELVAHQRPAPGRHRHCRPTPSCPEPAPLLKAAVRPYSLDDATIERVLQVFAATDAGLDLYDEQLRRWINRPLTSARGPKSETSVPRSSVSEKWSARSWNWRKV
jgi:hypothetical protein